MKKSVKVFDLLVAFVLSIILIIPSIVISLFIKFDSKGSIFYKQLRVGHLEKEFYIYKFRTMRTNSDNNGAITIGNDSRITKIGKILRKFKLDEIPQLINIFRGEMSFVGFRPDTPEYTEYYKRENNSYFDMMPGITGKASIYLSNEEDLMINVEDPKKFYIEKIIPQKVKLNEYHINNNNLLSNIIVMLETAKKIIFN